MYRALSSLELRNYRIRYLLIYYLKPPVILRPFLAKATDLTVFVSLHPAKSEPVPQVESRKGDAVGNGQKG